MEQTPLAPLFKATSMRRAPRTYHRPASQRLIQSPRAGGSHRRPVAAFRQRRPARSAYCEAFGPPEVWHEPSGREKIKYVIEAPGKDFIHPVESAEVAARIERLPKRFLKNLEVVHFSRMTRKRGLFPCYGMQWGTAVYLYPIEASLIEIYLRQPRPEQIIEARMFGGRWQQNGDRWELVWTPEAIRDFYLNNVLIHEIGHTFDDRNTSTASRERFANWFAIEYGYRDSRNRRG
jgi:hypothetical protein